MRIRTSYKHTIAACYLAAITQAIIVNFPPLLFVMFHTSYGISLGELGLLVSISFGIQLTVDCISIKLIDKIGYRAGIVLSHSFSSLGLVLMGILPDVMPPYAGLCTATVFYAIGAGLTEVLASPIVEACPTEEKSATMIMFHSIYGWGSAFAIAVSTLALYVFSMDSWRVITFAWAVIPFINVFYLLLVPINHLTEKGEGMKVRELFRTKVFWLFVLLMLCAGAAELSMGQWASAFAENGLQVSKTIGDFAGPFLFAICLGGGRVITAKFGEKIRLQKYLYYCALGCIGSYLLSALVPIPWIALLGCALCGFSVSAMWPGVLSLAARRCPKGGTAMFAILALAGDVGCVVGPALVGSISGAFSDNLRIGLLVATVFAIGLFISLGIYEKMNKSEKKEENGV